MLNMIKKIGMVHKLEYKEINEFHRCTEVNTHDINNLAIAMLDAFKDTVDFENETLEELSKEILEVIESDFGIFIPEASFQIKQNDQVLSVILVSLYKEKPLISELFTAKNSVNLGMASTLIKKSINALILLKYSDLVLYVHPKNFQAINLYKKIGFIDL